MVQTAQIESASVTAAKRKRIVVGTAVDSQADDKARRPDGKERKSFALEATNPMHACSALVLSGEEVRAKKSFAASSLRVLRDVSVVSKDASGEAPAAAVISRPNAENAHSPENAGVKANVKAEPPQKAAQRKRVQVIVS